MPKRIGMVCNASGANALSLVMGAGESAMVREIVYHLATAAAEDFKVTVDRKLAMQFKAPSGWNVVSRVTSLGRSIFDVINSKGWFKGIPVAKGQTLALTAPGANNFVEVVYDLGEADEFTADMPNGSNASDYQMFQIVSNSGTRATAGDLALDQSDIDAAFPAFPGGKVVPGNVAIECHAIYGGGASLGTGAANGEYTTYIKLIADREDIMDKGLVGVLYRGDSARTTATVGYTTKAGRMCLAPTAAIPSLIELEEPLVFSPNEELNVFATLARTGAGGDFAAADVKLGFFFTVHKQ